MVNSLERLRENWVALLVLVALVASAAYIHSVDTGLGSFLWIVSGVIVGVALFGPLVRAATRPWWGRLSQRQREALTGIMFASPFLIGFLVFTAGPMLYSLYVSFCKYDIINTPVWKGWNYNYGYIFRHDPNFPIALRNTFWYVLVKTPAIVLVSLLFALLLNQRVPGVRVFRTIFYMPTVITGVAAIFLWVWVLNPRGILNTGLAYLHVYTPLWFYDPSWTKPGLVIMSMWYLGSPMLILLAGLNNVPKSLYEAADVEGAGIFRKFRSITIPMLSPTLFFIILTNIIGAFQVFNSAYVISTSAGVTASQTPGDPDQSLLFYEVYMYTKFAAPVRDVGYACALAWILFVIILAITVIQLYLSRRWVYYES